MSAYNLADLSIIHVGEALNLVSTIKVQLNSQSFTLKYSKLSTTLPKSSDIRNSTKKKREKKLCFLLE
jgi:hypothetical protein